MPVEIKELVIRAVVTTQAEEGPSEPRDQRELPDRETIVEDCVRQVLKILKESKER
jgi:hypothetical protein